MRPNGLAESTNLMLWLISVSLSEVMACRRRDIGHAYSKPICGPRLVNPGPQGSVHKTKRGKGAGEKEEEVRKKETYHQSPEKPALQENTDFPPSPATSSSYSDKQHHPSPQTP
jgi:hypothetical protein